MGARRRIELPGNRTLKPEETTHARWLALSLALLFWVALAPLAQPVQAASPPHIMVVLMENHSYESVVGNSAMPFLNSLVASNGSVSTTDLSHPSLPNYLGLVSGSIQNNPPDTTPQDRTYPGPQLTDLLASAGIGWKAYMGDMARACDLTDQYGPGHYDVNHNPFMYFDSVRNNSAQCNRDVPYSQLAPDLSSGGAPPFIWVSPNTIDDMHDGTYAQGDQFLQGLVSLVRGSSWWTGSSRIIITWDEGTQSEQVLTLVVGSPHGTYAVGGREYGTLRGIEEAYGVGLLGASAAGNVGDILPLLTGPAPPPPPPPPPATPSSNPASAPSAGASPTTASPSATPATSSSPASVVSPRSSQGGLQIYVRGVYGRDSSASGMTTIAASGFNTVMTDPYKQALDPLTANGLKGVVWLGAWLSRPTCNFERSDALIKSQVAPIAGHPAILAYYLGDEPRVTDCPNAPVMFKLRSDLVHTLDPGSQTFTVIQAYENGVANDYTPWRGAVDILGFDVYPCANASTTCTFADIDVAIAAIGKAKIDRYWAVLQDFQDCYYRLPSARDLALQFDHWAKSGMSGYLVFSWNYQPAASSCAGTALDKHPDNLAQLKLENSRLFSPQPVGSSQPRAGGSILAAAAALARGALPLAAAVLAIGIGIFLFILLRRERGA